MELIRNWIEARYYTLWGCRRGRHLMKLSGCVYCGAGDGRIKVYEKHW